MGNQGRHNVKKPKQTDTQKAEKQTKKDLKKK
jgi:hypothetical protein